MSLCSFALFSVGTKATDFFSKEFIFIIAHLTTSEKEKGMTAKLLLL
jgi:hypothetical protein